MRDWRLEAGDGRQETGDRRWEAGGGGRETGDNIYVGCGPCGVWVECGGGYWVVGWRLEVGV